MKLIRQVLDRLYEIKAIHKFEPVLDAVDAALFGTDKTTVEAPHIVDSLDIKRYMGLVILALLPAIFASIYYFGLYPIAMIIVSYLAGGLVEVTFAIVRKKEIHEGFFVTGIIFPLVLPPTTPLWIVAVGVMAGVFFGKEIFGGTGRNVFNPALVGRLFITIAFPTIMTTSWRVPFSDAITSATPLGLFKTEHTLAPYLDLLLGKTAGSMGETFGLGLILGGIFLMVTKVSNWRIPLSYLGMVLVLSAIGSYFLPVNIAPPLFQLLSGGLLLGAFFMATDPVTSPFTLSGKYIFGIGCGVLTVLIRGFSGYVEGVMFSIVLMNAFTPLIDDLVLRVKYRGARG